MIIESVTKIPNHDVERYAWRGLAQYLNVNHTANLISFLHNLPEKHATNARKQAEQIRFCMMQAKEYFDAGRGVSLATRPVLLYYTVMSLALAEILLKQTADSRLSQLRAHHNCHGLTLGIASEPRPSDSLAEASSKLVAKPKIGPDGDPRGTFEVWRRSAREYPVGGYHTTTYGSKASSTKFDVLFYPDDKPPLAMNRQGLSLRDCLVNLPYMEGALVRWGDELQMVRGGAESSLDYTTSRRTMRLIIHPGSDKLFEAFGNLCSLSPDLINKIQLADVPSGAILTWEDDGLRFSLPHVICVDAKRLYFACASNSFGEFGYLYVALHVLGSFARYYPEHWIKHIETNSPLASAADDLCSFAFVRIPLLALSELARSYHIVEA